MARASSSLLYFVPMQAKDINDLDMLGLVWEKQCRPYTDYFGSPAHIPHWAMIWDIRSEFPDDVPTKVIRAKLEKLIRRGLMDGCTCGCRGDYELTDKGREMLGVLPPALSLRR